MTAPALADNKIVSSIFIKENEPPALRKKIAPKAQVFKRSKSSRFQGSGLPGGADANVVVAIAEPIADEEAVLVEDADT